MLVPSVAGCAGPLSVAGLELFQGAGSLCAGLENLQGASPLFCRS